MAAHEQSVGKTDEWYTPPYVFTALGCSFDTDVASPGRRVTPWIPAQRFIDKQSPDDLWDGFVWMNPPYGGRNGKVPWLKRFFAHGNGIALLPDRTSAPWWQHYAPRADIVLFVASKIKFIGIDGNPGKQPGNGTSLFGIGERGRKALIHASEAGLGIIMIAPNMHSPTLPRTPIVTHPRPADDSHISRQSESSPLSRPSTGTSPTTKV